MIGFLVVPFLVRLYSPFRRLVRFLKDRIFLHAENTTLQRGLLPKGLLPAKLVVELGREVESMFPAVAAGGRGCAVTQQPPLSMSSAVVYSITNTILWKKQNPHKKSGMLPPPGELGALGKDLLFFSHDD